MKLDLSLPERPGLLHALPVFDLFLMLWIVFVLSSALNRQTGVAIELPASQFELERYDNTLVVTIASGEPAPQVYFGRDALSVEELQARLQKLHDKGAQRNSLVLLRADRSIPVGVQRRIEELALELDFRVAVLGVEQTEPAPAEVKPEPAPEPEPTTE